MRTLFSARLKRTALVAVFALATHALLPFLHAHAISCDRNHTACAADERAGEPASSDSGQSSNHPDACAVCSALAHGGARAIDAPSALPVHFTELRLGSAPRVAEVVAPSADVEVACARAPPLSRRSA
jgi:hypothetical protein